MWVSIGNSGDIPTGWCNTVKIDGSCDLANAVSVLGKAFRRLYVSRHYGDRTWALVFVFLKGIRWLKDLQRTGIVGSLKGRPVNQREHEVVT